MLRAMEIDLKKIRNRFDGILFDLDGTLVDTAPDLCGALNHVLDTLGLTPMNLADVKDLIGDGARVLLSRSLAHHQVETAIEPLFDQLVAYYGQNIARESTVFPSLLPILEQLDQAGMALAVCTNKPEALSRQLLAELKIDHFFGAVVGSDSLPVRKPNPGHIHGTLQSINVTADRALMIGDSANDVNAAKAARLPVIAVSFGYTTTPARELGADITIDHFDELPGAIAKLS